MHAVTPTVEAGTCDVPKCSSNSRGVLCFLFAILSQWSFAFWSVCFTIVESLLNSSSKVLQPFSGWAAFHVLSLLLLGLRTVRGLLRWSVELLSKGKRQHACGQTNAWLQNRTASLGQMNVLVPENWGGGWEHD